MKSYLDMTEREIEAEVRALVAKTGMSEYYAREVVALSHGWPGCLGEEIDAESLAPGGS